MLEGYLPLFVFLTICIAFPLGALLMGKLLRPSAPFRVKLEAYECGIESLSGSRGRYTVRFYLVAILFVIFDVETVFLFPWAVSLGDIGPFGFWSMMAFLGVLTVGFIYEWCKGALDWE